MVDSKGVAASECFSCVLVLLVTRVGDRTLFDGCICHHQHAATAENSLSRYHGIPAASILEKPAQVLMAMQHLSDCATSLIPSVLYAVPSHGKCEKRCIHHDKARRLN